MLCTDMIVVQFVPLMLIFCMSGLKGIACWLHSQLDGRALICIRLLWRDLRFFSLAFWYFSFPCYTAAQYFGKWILACWFLVASQWLSALPYSIYLILQGSYVYDINGKKYIDALAGLWCTALGMCKLRCQILHYSCSSTHYLENFMLHFKNICHVLE
jgi:hypothetical protein